MWRQRGSSALGRLLRTSNTARFGSATATARKQLVVDNPFTLGTHATVDLSTEAEAKQMVESAAKAQTSWKNSSMEERVALCKRWVQEMQNASDQIAQDISGSMGKTVKQAKGEMGGLVERAEGMIALGPEVLKDEILPEKPGFARRIQKNPVGVVFLVAPWNYPLLCAVNCIVPAVLAGNSVVIKHSSRTPLVANAMADAFTRAGAPAGLVQPLSCSHSVVDSVIQLPQVGFVSFTGSVPGGYAIQSSVAKRVDLDATLELGGKDPAYIAEDADMDLAVATVVDGATFNAGQSCCAIERCYVHESKYDEFLERAQKILKNEKLGDPADASTTMGPLAQASAVKFIQSQVDDAKAKGARILVGGSATSVDGKGRFFEPTLLADCNHDMEIVMEESFGPVLPVVKVSSDEEAVTKMNDSPYGLTAAVFTRDVDRANKIGEQIRTGTFFMNRCDYLDPELPWTGHNQTGKGISLSRHGFNGVTKVKGYHMKL